MTLRRELSLLFGGILLVFVALVVGTGYFQLRDSLAQELKKQFSPQPFLQLVEVEREVLVERSRALVKNQEINAYRRELLPQGEMADPEEALAKVLRAARAGKDPEYRTRLFTLYDQTLGRLEGTARSSSNDLIVVISEYGQVMMEVLGSTYEDFARDPNLAVTVETLKDTPIMDAIVNDLEDSNGGFLIYPDKKLYLYGSSWFLKGDFFEGAALVGREVNRKFLQRVAGDASVFVIFEHGVVGSDEDSQALGEVMRSQVDEGRMPDETWKSGGRTYLVKHAPLTQVVGEQEFTRGHIFFLADLSVVEKKALDQARSILLMGLAAMALALLTIPAVAVRVTAPIVRLSRAMKGVGEGRLEKVDLDQKTSLEVRDAAVSFNEMVIGLRQKKVLEHFVPEGTIQELHASQGAAPELGGERLERTIMFSDLRGFTSMSERLPAKQVVEVLNRYLEVMSRAIREQGGDINEFIGDAILAVFEDPNASVRAARDMNEALLLLHQETDLPELKNLRQGIGLHTGDLVEGNIGDLGGRLKRAVIGDTVNLAARIQDRSRDGRHTCIFLSGTTKALLTEEFDLELFGNEDFKGKSEPVEVWEVRS